MLSLLWAARAVGMMSATHCSAQVSGSPDVCQLGGAFEASSRAKSCSAPGHPAACMALFTAVPSQNKCSLSDGGAAGSGATATSRKLLPPTVEATLSVPPGMLVGSTTFLQ